MRTHTSWYLTHWSRDRMSTISQTAFFKRMSFNGNVWISIEISLKFVSKGPFDNRSALFQIMAWRRTGGMPLPEPITTQFNDAYMLLGARTSTAPTNTCHSRFIWYRSSSGFAAVLLSNRIKTRDGNNPIDVDLILIRDFGIGLASNWFLLSGM